MSASAQFPSGEWIGYYIYGKHPRRFLMDLILEFKDGRITGEGSDGIGLFVIAGHYSESSLECSWVKSYVGKHSVHYTGYREGKGIWGTWTLEVISGGFHIWPLGQQSPSEALAEALTIEEEIKISQPG